MTRQPQARAQKRRQPTKPASQATPANQASQPARRARPTSQPATSTSQMGPPSASTFPVFTAADFPIFDPRPIFRFSNFPIFRFSDFPIFQFPAFPIFRFFASKFARSRPSEIVRPILRSNFPVQFFMAADPSNLHTSAKIGRARGKLDRVSGSAFGTKIGRGGWKIGRGGWKIGRPLRGSNFCRVRFSNFRPALPACGPHPIFALGLCPACLAWLTWLAGRLALLAGLAGSPGRPGWLAGLAGWRGRPGWPGGAGARTQGPKSMQACMPGQDRGSGPASICGWLRAGVKLRQHNGSRPSTAAEPYHNKAHRHSWTQRPLRGRSPIFLRPFGEILAKSILILSRCLPQARAPSVNNSRRVRFGMFRCLPQASPDLAEKAAKPVALGTAAAGEADR